MADLQGLFSDPRFNDPSMTLEQQKAILARIDPSYSQIGDKDFLALRTHLQGQAAMAESAGRLGSLRPTPQQLKPSKGWVDPGTMQPVKGPGEMTGDERLGALAKLAGTIGLSALPFGAEAAVAHPLATALGTGAGLAGSKLAKAIASMAGAGPGGQELAGVGGGALVGGAAGTAAARVPAAVRGEFEEPPGLLAMLAETPFGRRLGLNKIISSKSAMPAASSAPTPASPPAPISQGLAANFPGVTGTGSSSQSPNIPPLSAMGQFNGPPNPAGTIRPPALPARFPAAELGDLSVSPQTSLATGRVSTNIRPNSQSVARVRIQQQPTTMAEDQLRKQLEASGLPKDLTNQIRALLDRK